MNTSALRICHHQMLLKMNFGFRSIQLAKIMIFSTYPRLIYLVSFHPFILASFEIFDFSSKILIFRGIDFGSKSHLVSFRRNFWILAKYLEALPEKCGNNSIRPDRFELFQRTRIKKWNDPQVSSTLNCLFADILWCLPKIKVNEEERRYGLCFSTIETDKKSKRFGQAKKDEDLSYPGKWLKSNASQKDMKLPIPI